MALEFYFQEHIQEILQMTALAHRHGKVIVLATGVFDLFHEEHANYLRAAKNAGDVLVVAIESDTRTRELKGEGRPVHNEQERLLAVRKLPEVEFSFILPEDFNTQQEYEELIVQLKPQIYAVSSHSGHLENKRALVEKHGGRLAIVHEHNPEISTTKILNQ